MGAELETRRGAAHAPTIHTVSHHSRSSWPVQLLSPSSRTHDGSRGKDAQPRCSQDCWDWDHVATTTTTTTTNTTVRNELYNNNEKFILRRKMQKQTQRRRSLHIGKTHDKHLEACCRGISSCLAGDNPKLPSSHRHCYEYLNGAKLRLSDLHNDDSRYWTARCSLTSNPRTNL